MKKKPTKLADEIYVPNDDEQVIHLGIHPTLYVDHEIRTIEEKVSLLCGVIALETDIGKAMRMLGNIINTLDKHNVKYFFDGETFVKDKVENAFHGCEEAIPQDMRKYIAKNILESGTVVERFIFDPRAYYRRCDTSVVSGEYTGIVAIDAGALYNLTTYGPDISDE